VNVDGIFVGYGLQIEMVLKPSQAKKGRPADGCGSEKDELGEVVCYRRDP
jgi:hypothetical protein